MNFLAHLALSHTAEQMTGNFLGDLVRNEHLEALPQDIREGVFLHRKIDVFTDAHRDVLQAKCLFSKQYRRVSGIVLDVYFDYLLSRHWATFYAQSLPSFIDDAKAELSQRQGHFPERALFFFQGMCKYNILESYQSLDGIEIALKRIDQRFKRPIGLELAMADVYQNEAEIEGLFLSFYPQLIAMVKA